MKIKAVVLVLGTSLENHVEHEFSNLKEAREFYSKCLSDGYEVEFHRM